MSKIDGPTGPSIPLPIANPGNTDPKPQQDTDAANSRAPLQTSGYLTSEEGQARRSEILNKISASQPKTGGSPSQAYDDAYWAKQPPEVQKLRDIQDPAERTAMVSDLILKGYTIDVPIMLYGWGPHQTNQLRAAYGYTWVPSATMEGIIMAPGLTAPGYPSYDPNHPPPGAILIDPSEMDNNPFKDYLKPPDYAKAPGSDDHGILPFAKTVAFLGTPSGPSPASSAPPSPAFSSQPPPASTPAGTASSAKLVSPSGQSTAIPANLLSDLNQAAGVQQRLASLGYDLPVTEQQPAGDQEAKYGKEKRRPYAVGGLNAGIVQSWYDRMKEEEANKLVTGVMNIDRS